MRVVSRAQRSNYTIHIILLSSGFSPYQKIIKKTTVKKQTILMGHMVVMTQKSYE